MTGIALPDGARPTCLVWDRSHADRAWCGTRRHGVLRSDDGGRTWLPSGPEGEHVTAIASDPAEAGVVWAGTEPSAMFRNDGEWERLEQLERLPSSKDWSFPPKPETHHVRWIACHPSERGRLWVAIEAGALIQTRDGGRTWSDRVPGGPYDTHELAVHDGAPDRLRSAAGDGYFESDDGGATWRSPQRGLDARYLRSVAIDPGDPAVVVASAASHAHAAYVAGRSDGRVYRRSGEEDWIRITGGWPERPSTIAPLLQPGREGGELWAADERGLHHSADGGARWRRVAAFDTTPNHLRALAIEP